MPGTATASLREQLSAVVTDTADAPTRAPLGTRVRWTLVIRRIEFMVVYLSMVLLPAVLGAHTWSDVGSLNTVLAMLFVVSHLQVANMVNALADREQDLQLKSRQSDAVYGLGVRRVVTHIVVSTLICLVLAGFLAVRTQHWDLLGYAVGAMLIGFAYSLPPTHLKGAGFLQLVALQLGCCFLPGMVVLRTYGHHLEWAAVLTLAGSALAVTSLFVTSHGEDYLVDGRFGIRTYVRSFGLLNAFYLQSAMLLAGAALIVLAVAAGYGLSWGFVPFVVAWLLSQRLLGTAILDVRRNTVEDATAILHRKSLIGPYHSALVGWATVVLVVFVLAAR